MAEDMIERAARAIADKWLEKVDDSTVRVGPPVLARAALLAALDPEDEALVEKFAHGRWMRRFKHASSMDWHVQKAEAIMHPGVQNSYAAEMASARQDIAALQIFADEAQGNTKP